MNQFIHLHAHTEYSLLDGASRIDALVARAAELEMPALALTDHGVMYGAIHFYKACVQAGIKPILGCECYVAPRRLEDREGRSDRDPYHLTVLAADAEGYRNLMGLCTLGQTRGFYYRPRIDREVLARHSKGLIVLSGCLGGEVATKVTGGDDAGARETVAAYRDIFGPDRYLLEVQRFGHEPQERVNRALQGFSKEFGLRLVATNDLHYVHQHEAEAHDVLLCLQTGANFDDPNRWRFQSNDFYLKSAAEMARSYPDLPEALASTVDVAAQVDLKIDLGISLLPPYEVPQGLTADQHLRNLVLDGVRWRYGDRPERKVLDRADSELAVIAQTGYASYFLIVWDFYNFARRNGIVTGPGRGSAAGSLVAYCLGITDLEPLQHGLIFERFLNQERVSMPDIDCDFSVEGREKVIRYVSERYGSDRVAQIITFTTMASKAAIRDVGRVLDVPLRECDRLSKLVPVYQGRSKSLDDTLKEVPEFREAYEAGAQRAPDGRTYDVRRLVDVARSLEGVSRNVSTHAAGVVIAPEPLVRYTPLQLGPGKDTVITQYDMKAVQEIGLLKMDFLGLQNLDIISTCLDLVEERRGLRLDLDKVGYDDPKTYELVSAADTTGVFQLDGSGMRRMLQEMRPQSFADITAANALFRPGPMQNIPAYLARKQGREPIEYMHERLAPILEDTYGVMIYQEQVMMAARELAGFTLSEADILRAAMGKKDKVMMARQREKFVAGCQKNGIAEAKAAELFDAIAKFAEYGFNKCLDGGTELVEATTGARVAIRDLFKSPRPFYVHSLGLDGRVRPRPVSHVYSNGRKPVFRLTSTSGRSVVATATHRFKVPGGWARLGELNPGDLVALARRLPTGKLVEARAGEAEGEGAGPDTKGTEDVSWERVAAIRPAGVADTYDLTVGPDHNFVAGGFVVHNSHASAYAVISYRTAYLKANYPIEYMTALLINQEGSSDRVAATIVDCKKRGIDVMPPDVNESRADFTIVDDGRIRFGLAAIKNVGRGAVEQMVAERDQGGAFSSLDNLCERVAGVQDVNIRALDALVRSGACDALGERNFLLLSLDGARLRAERARRDRESGQTSLFGQLGVDQAGEAPAAGYGIQVEPMPPEEKLRSEKELLGLYLSDHPLNRIEAELALRVDAQATQVTTDIAGTEVRVGGLVRDLRRVVTRSGQIMAYAELEDLTGTIEVTLFPRSYEQYRHLFEPDRVVVVQGKVEAARGGRGRAPAAPAPVTDEELEVEEEAERAAVIADAVWDWDDPECGPVERRRTAHVDVPPEYGPEVVEDLLAVIARHPGPDQVMLHFHVQGSLVTMQVGERFRVCGDEVKTELDSHFGRDVTRLELVRPVAPAAGPSANGGAGGNGRPGRRGNGYGREGGGNGKPRA